MQLTARLRAFLPIVLCAAGTASAKTAPADPVAIVAALDAMILAHHAREGVLKYMSPDFVEHDPKVKRGDRQGLLDYLDVEHFDMGRNAGSRMVDVVDRRFGSGEYVVTQHHILAHEGDSGVVICETYRVVDGLIVEHWDIMQPVPAGQVNPHVMW